MAFDDSNSPEYQKFKVDKLPKIVRFHTVDYKLLLAYYKHKYNKTVTPVQRRNGKSIPTKIKCPKCGASVALVATTESSMVHPTSVYGITKQVQGQLVHLVCQSIGIESVSLSLFLV